MPEHENEKGHTSAFELSILSFSGLSGLGANDNKPALYDNYTTSKGKVKETSIQHNSLRGRSHLAGSAPVVFLIKVWQIYSTYAIIQALLSDRVLSLNSNAVNAYNISHVFTFTQQSLLLLYLYSCGYFVFLCARFGRPPFQTGQASHIRRRTGAACLRPRHR